jgi:hypothetical protein
VVALAGADNVEAFFRPRAGNFAHDVQQQSLLLKVGARENSPPSQALGRRTRASSRANCLRCGSTSAGGSSSSGLRGWNRSSPQRSPARSRELSRRCALVPLSVTRRRDVSPTGHCSENLIVEKQRPHRGARRRSGRPCRQAAARGRARRRIARWRGCAELDQTGRWAAGAACLHGFRPGPRAPTCRLRPEVALARNCRTRHFRKLYTAGELPQRTAWNLCCA